MSDKNKSAKKIAKSAPKNKPPAPNDALDTGALKDAPEITDAPLGTLSAATEGGDALQAQPKAEALRLPRGAFIAYRKSGGLQFSTREVVIYPDGRAAYDVRGVPQKEYNRLRRVLNDGQMLLLRKLLDQTGFWKAESAGTQNPDAFAYEITARLGQRANTLEIFQGSMPENLKPLFERLDTLLPES